MLAIIIKDKDAMALLERLELAKFQRKEHVAPDIKAAIDDMHQWFHYVVVSWLQEQGARTIR